MAEPDCAGSVLFGDVGRLVYLVVHTKIIALPRGFELSPAFPSQFSKPLPCNHQGSLRMSGCVFFSWAGPNERHNCFISAGRQTANSGVAGES